MVAKTVAETSHKHSWMRAEREADSVGRAWVSTTARRARATRALVNMQRASAGEICQTAMLI
jgi:hypothetical protein